MLRNNINNNNNKMFLNKLNVEMEPDQDDPDLNDSSKCGLVVLVIVLPNRTRFSRTICLAIAVVPRSLKEGNLVRLRGFYWCGRSDT